MPRKTYDEIAAAIAIAKAAGMIWNVEFKDLKDDANRALESESKALPIAYWDSIKHLPKANDLSTLASRLHYTHGLGGYLKRAEKHLQRNPDAETRAVLEPHIALARRWLPVEEGIAALKPLVQKGRRVIPVTDEKRAEIAADAAARRTCQICGRAILPDADGKLAHHGYERPYGQGYHTASCYGAREMKFEADRSVLGRYIEEVMKPMRDRIAASLAFWTSYTGPIFKRRSEVTGNTQVSTTGGEGWREHAAGGIEAKRTIEIERGTAERDLRMIERDIKDQQKRYDTWVKTEE